VILCRHGYGGLVRAPRPARNVLVNVGTNGRNASQEVVLRLFNSGFDLAS